MSSDRCVICAVCPPAQLVFCFIWIWRLAVAACATRSRDHQLGSVISRGSSTVHGSIAGAIKTYEKVHLLATHINSIHGFRDTQERPDLTSPTNCGLETFLNMQSHPNHRSTCLIQPYSICQKRCTSLLGCTGEPNMQPASNTNTTAVLIAGRACQKVLSKGRPTTPYDSEPPTSTPQIVARHSRASSLKKGSYPDKHRGLILFHIHVDPGRSFSWRR